MSIWGKIVGGAAGMMIGGPLGALAGAVAGHYAIDRRNDDAKTGAAETGAQNQVAFTIGVIALGAKMAKADGHVTRDEIKAFREVFRVPFNEVENVARIFNLARQDVAGYEAYAGQLARMFGPRAPILEDVLDGLFHITMADNVVHPGELDFLREVARRFGFEQADFDRIAARYVHPEANDPYLILGASRETSDSELRDLYRELVRENHPDKVIARGVPEEFVAIANDRLAAINDAWDRVRKERGL